MSHRSQFQGSAFVLTICLLTASGSAQNDLRFKLLGAHHSGVYDEGAAETLALYLNTPNPFNPSTQIVYQIPESGQVDLTIYNILGQQIRVLIRDHQGPGQYEVLWDGRDGFGRYVSRAVFFYRLAHPGGTLTNRMLLVK